MVERDDPAVDLGADTAVADLGVHAVGKIDRRRADRQAENIALGGKDKDLIDHQVDLQAVHEIFRVLQLALPFEHLAEPGHFLVEHLVGHALLVAPVGGDAVLGDPVHLPGADLDLHRLAARRR